MQKVMGYLRRAVLDYDMIEDGDKIAVGMSGGKDSTVLLAALCGLKRFLGKDFTLIALTLDPGFGETPTDFSPIKAFCDELGVEYIVHKTRLGSIIFDERREKSPCSLCAKMRRGILHDQAKAAGCNKIALGHHMDDAVETFLMSLFTEARIGCFQPVSYLSVKDLTMIRPMIYLPEKEIIRVVAQNGYPVVKSKCPVDGITSRQKMKEFIAQREQMEPGFKQRVFRAMRKDEVNGWHL